MPAIAPIRIVIPGDEPAQLQGSPHLDRLRAHGEVSLYTTRPADDADKIRRCEGATCMINSRGAVKWPGHLLDRLPDLRFVTTCGTGTDAIDLEAAGRLGIVVSNLPGRTAPIVAEHAIALMFAVARRAAFQTQEIKHGRWQALNQVFLQGKTLGLIGAGPIGAELARLARAIGMNVLAWTFHPSAERAAALGVHFATLEEVLQASDVISVHLKLTDQSRGLVGVREISLMKPGALFINTARGAVVDNAALAAALQSGQLGGAGIDVFEVEPVPPNHPLLPCDNVVLTPHVADQTPEGMELLNSGVVENVIAFLEGKTRFRVV